MYHQQQHYSSLGPEELKWKCIGTLEHELREALTKKKMFSFGHCPNYLSHPPPPPNLGNLYHFFGRQKRRLVRITEPSNDGYDICIDVSDNCDHNIGTFDDFGVDQKVSHNMILMSKYKGQLGGKKGKKKSGKAPPPLFGQCPKENIFLQEVLP